MIEINVFQNLIFIKDSRFIYYKICTFCKLSYKILCNHCHTSKYLSFVTLNIKNKHTHTHCESIKDNIEGQKRTWSLGIWI